MNAVKYAENPAEKRAAKQQLYSFTPSVYIEKGDKRKYSNIKYYTGLMQIDLDGIEDHRIADDLKHWLFEQDECVCSYFSPSGNVKGLIHIETPVNKDHYKRLFNSIEEKYEQTGYFDIATKNLVLPLFLSVDENILWRPIEDTTPWIREKIKQKNFVHHSATPTYDFEDPNENPERRTLSILKNKFDNINDFGHPQVRSAALVLGSRVGAGYIAKVDAEIAISNFIRSNQYLSKDVDGYIKTAYWGIAEGIKNPKYY
jgi:hypothetical protein